MSSCMSGWFYNNFVCCTPTSPRSVKQCLASIKEIGWQSVNFAPGETFAFLHLQSFCISSVLPVLRSFRPSASEQGRHPGGD